MTSKDKGKAEYQKKRRIQQDLILQCDCRLCHEVWSNWYEKSKIFGIVTRTSYTGSHLEDKPSMYAEVTMVDWDDNE